MGPEIRQDSVLVGEQHILQDLPSDIRITSDFFRRDVLEVAPSLPGKLLCRRFDDGKIFKSRITEVEAYRGTDDLACHASKGRTARTEIMFGAGGSVYVYLIYGMYWMLNFVTGEQNVPQAVLIRGVESVSGPGRLAREYGINKDFYGEDIGISLRLWLEDSDEPVKVYSSPRIGINYAGEYWASRPWRYTACIDKR